jgi:hypothetical protein
MEDAGPQRLGVVAGCGAGFRRGAVFLTLLSAFLSISGLQAGVIHPSDRLTEDERIRLIRDLSSEYANAKIAIPRSKKPLEFNADGTYDKMQWHDDALTMGQAARLGDKLQITKVTLDGDHMILEINGGLMSGDKWYKHVQVGMGGVGGGSPSGNDPYKQAGTTGTYIDLNFHKPMENLSSADVKKILAPVLDFDKRSAVQLYSETLSPEMKQAIAEKRVLVGMDRDEVLLVLGHPDHKYRESKDGVESEDWIFGMPPGKVTFVTFNGSKVVKVKDEYAGLGGQVSGPQ